MNMLPALAHAFGIEPATLERLVEAYEEPDILPQVPYGEVLRHRAEMGFDPDRLALIKARMKNGETLLSSQDEDIAWLLAECKRLRETEPAVRRFLWLHHGCELTRLYGDDGEMQCCGGPASRPHRPMDFLRQPIPELIAALREDWRRNAMVVLADRSTAKS